MCSGVRASRHLGILMKKQRQAENEQEPVGIIISGGSRTEGVPRFSAYVWGPVPDGETEASGEMVAV